MSEANILQQTAGHMEKIMAMILWKLQGKTPVELTMEDLKKFSEEFDDDDAQLLVHGHTDGIRISVMTASEAKEFIEQYKSDERGIVLGG